MYRYRELPEPIYITMVNKFDHQIHRLEKGMSQVKPITYSESSYVKHKIDTIVSKGDQMISQKYMQYRAQNISSYKVIEYLQQLKMIHV